MEWTALKTLLEGKKLEITFVGSFSNKVTTLTADSAATTQPALGLTFHSLGNGTNKRAFRVKKSDGTETPWVLALGTNVLSSEADLKREAEILLRLGTKGLRVPQPFGTSGLTPSNVVFKVDMFENGDDYKASAFIQEFMAGSVEMPKTLSEKTNFVATQILNNAAATPQIVLQAADDLKKIRAEFLRDPWADFQVFYHGGTGRMYVFDPADMKIDTLKVVNEGVLTTWWSDMGKALTTKWTGKGLDSHGGDAVAMAKFYSENTFTA